MISDSDVDCKQCDAVLAELEHIDDEAEGGGVDFVKIDDKEFARQMGVFALPAVVFFRHGKLEPVIYAGDLKNEERILDWLLVQKDLNTDVIEEFDDNDMLIDFIRKMEFVAVYFCNKNHLISHSIPYNSIHCNLFLFQITNRTATTARISWTSWRTLTTTLTATASTSSKLRI